MPGGQPTRPRGEAARGHAACYRHRDLPGHSRTHARRFGTATIHAGFGWCALSACFETRASACCALTAYAPFRASPPVTGRFVCFETPPAGADSLASDQGLAPPARARPYAGGYPSMGHGSRYRWTHTLVLPHSSVRHTPCASGVFARVSLTIWPDLHLRHLAMRDGH